jgi:hypothetical protein
MLRITTAISGLAVLIATFIATAPASFATRLPPPADGNAPPSTTRLAHHAGLTSLNVVLILVAAVLVLAVAGAVVVRLRRRPRTSPALSQ